ncbi:MAG: hypothetical protein GF421_12385 [Candidatus Aminicenantes bacterium]|nr:hypothetical protein [Candidatus Aminicenantes bacterium]
MKILILVMTLFLGSGNFLGMTSLEKEKQTDSPEKIIIQIYHEIKDMGPREGEDFIKREFHFDLDGRKQNREEHILVFSYVSRNQQIFSIQITYYEDENSKDYQGRALEIKDINCLITDETAEIKESSYSQEEIKSLLPQVLKGIQRERELLSLIRKSK